MPITQRVHSGQTHPTDVDIDRPPVRNLRHAFAFLWAALSVVLLVLSVQTVRASLPAPGREADTVALVIAGLEAVAAVLFIIPRTLRIGAAGLIATLAATAAVQATRGEFGGSQLIEIAAVFFVMTHGPILPGDARRARRERAAGRDAEPR